jgi:APA family basic amino acid/polyamine antiporter
MADDRLFFRAVARVHPRYKTPYVARPYRVPGYPVLPALFIAAVAYLVGNALVTDPVWTGVTFAIVLAGIPVYFAFFREASTNRGGAETRSS